MKSNAKLTEGSIEKQLFFMTIPMTIGIFSILAFNLVDTIFVAKLGVRELAAMSFTFPIVMLVTNIGIGLGKAASSIVSRAIGEGDQTHVRRLASDSMMLAFLFSVVFVVIGLLTLEPTFLILGAAPDLLPLIREYMEIWYFGVMFLIVPMVGNNIIRATGDAKFPMMIMVAATLINLVLDPIFIFGFLGVPALGLRGAAIASVIARALTLLIAVLHLYFKEKVLEFSFPKLAVVLNSWKQFLYIAVPASLTNILVPLSMGIVTRMVAGFGEPAVAAVGAALRVEGLTLTVVMALSAALAPIVGQNWGAKKFDRVYRAIQQSSRFSIFWGIFCFGVLFLFAKPIAHLFSKETEVVHYMVNYLWIAPVGYGLLGIFQLNNTCFNAINKPVSSTILNIVRMFLVYIPFAYIGSIWFHLIGLFIGTALANVLTGLVSVIWFDRVRKEEEARLAGI